MIVTKFHENRLTIDREISEKHAVTFNVTLGITGEDRTGWRLTLYALRYLI